MCVVTIFRFKENIKQGKGRLKLIREVKYNKKNLEDRKIENNLQVARIEYFDDGFKSIREAYPSYLSNAVGELKTDDQGRKYFIDVFNKKTPTLYRVFDSDLVARKALEEKELLIGETFCLIRSTLKDAFPEASGSIKEVKKYIDSYNIYWNFSSDEEKQESMKKILKELEYKVYIKK